MHRPSLFLVSSLLLAATTSPGQTGPTDSQVLQALLAEVRQLNQYLQATTIAAQRTQILLHRLQGQDAAVARASDRLEEARDAYAGAQAGRRQLEAELHKLEQLVSASQGSPAQRKVFEERLPQEKARLDASEAQERQEQARETEAEQQLRTEEAALAELRDQLDKLDESLQSAHRRLSARPSAGSPQGTQP